MDKQTRAEYWKQWQKKNRKKCKEYEDRWKQKNHDKYVAKYKRRNADFKQNLSKKLFFAAKVRAKKYSVPFSIELSDIMVPTNCPVLGIPLIMGDKYAHDNSPSLDRIIPELGYVKGNIMVISHKANTIKSNANVEELEKVFLFYKNLRGDKCQ